MKKLVGLVGPDKEIPLPIDVVGKSDSTKKITVIYCKVEQYGEKQEQKVKHLFPSSFFSQA